MMTVKGNLRLSVQQSRWAMSGLGDGETEWSMEQKFEKLAEAGFTGILGRVPQVEEMDKWHRLLREYSFSFGFQMAPFPRAGDDITSFLQMAKQFGAWYVNAQVVDQYTIGTEAITGLKGLIQQAEQVGIPFFVETHRGRITQDLLRTADYVQALLLCSGQTGWEGNLQSLGASAGFQKNRKGTVACRPFALNYSLTRPQK